MDIEKPTLWLDTGILFDFIPHDEAKARAVLTAMDNAFKLATTTVIRNEYTTKPFDVDEDELWHIDIKGALLEEFNVELHESEVGTDAEGRKIWVKNRGEKSIIELFESGNEQGINLAKLGHLVASDDKFFEQPDIAKYQPSVLTRLDLANHLLAQGGEYTPDLYKDLRDRSIARDPGSSDLWYTNEEADQVFNGESIEMTSPRRQRIIFKNALAAIGELTDKAGKSRGEESFTRIGNILAKASSGEGSERVTAEILPRGIGQERKLSSAAKYLMEERPRKKADVQIKMFGESVTVGLTLGRPISRSDGVPIRS